MLSSGRLGLLRGDEFKFIPLSYMRATKSTSGWKLGFVSAVAVTVVVIRAVVHDERVWHLGLDVHRGRRRLGRHLRRVVVRVIVGRRWLQRVVRVHMSRGKMEGGRKGAWRINDALEQVVIIRARGRRARTIHVWREVIFFSIRLLNNCIE